MNPLKIAAILFLTWSLCCSSLIQAQEFEKYHTRKGIPNFQAKIEKDDSVRIIYFGGSITNAPGWRVKSFNWLKEKYPNSHLKQINASIGGTGSNLGAFRFKDDVLRQQS